jgi:hypothetical protein
MTTQTGNPGPFRIADEVEWDERNGTQTVLVYRGAKREIEGLVPTYMVAGYRVKWRQESGDIWRIEIRAAQALDGSDTTAEAAVQIQWDLDGNDYSISIYKQMVLRAVPQNLVSVIEASVNQLRAGTFTRDVLINAAPSGIIATATTEGYDTTNAVGWFDLVLSGVETHDVSNFVLRKTTTAPNSTVSGATLNVGKLYTTTQLMTEQGSTIPTGISAEFPAGGYWKKNTPRRSTQGNGKIQIQQDWQHTTTFSALQYDLVT